MTGTASDLDRQHPLVEEGARHTVRKPEVRYDRQGDLPDDQRVANAMRNFVKDFGRTAAIYMEACIHCGMCAEACHYYHVTEDPKYTPIWKLEPFKQAYKREYGPFAFFYRALNLKAKVTAAELQEWQHLLYDSCTVCGRCSLMCPMGIDIASLVSQARHGMFHAGLVPHELWAVAERGARRDAQGLRRPHRMAGRRPRDRHSARQGAGRRDVHHVVDRDHEVPRLDRRHGADHAPSRRGLDVPHGRLRGHQLRAALRQCRVAEGHDGRR